MYSWSRSRRNCARRKRAEAGNGGSCESGLKNPKLLLNLGFRFLDPLGYEQVEKSVNARRKQGEAFLAKTQQIITDKLKEAGIQARVESRIKRVYSIHKKLQRQRISVEQVYDLYAMRVITRSLQDCYAVLGLLHSTWRPVPGRSLELLGKMAEAKQIIEANGAAVTAWQPLAGLVNGVVPS